MCVCARAQAFPAKGETEASSKQSYGLLEVSQLSNDGESFSFDHMSQEVVCRELGGWGRRKIAQVLQVESALSSVALAPCCRPLRVSPSV